MHYLGEHVQVWPLSVDWGGVAAVPASLLLTLMLRQLLAGKQTFRSEHDLQMDTKLYHVIAVTVCL